MKLFDATEEATLDGARRLRQTLQRQLTNTRINPDIASDLCLAVNEAAANAVTHGEPAPSWVGVRVAIRGKALEIEITDDGGPFTDFAAQSSSVGAPAQMEARERGLGLSLIQDLLNEIAYQPGPPNVLRGRRKLYRARPAVLLVEDSETLLRLYAGFLGERFRVKPARSVAAARETLLSEPVDIVVSDFHLGGDTAVNLLTAMQDGPLDRPIPTVLITQDRKTATEGAVLQAGVEQFLLKPITPAALNRAVDLAISSHQKRLSHFFSYFGRDAQTLLSPRLPEELGDYRCRVVHGTALWGGGDFTLYLPAGGRQRVVLGDAMGHGLPAKATALTYAAMLRTIDALGEGNAARFLERLSAAVGHRHFPAGMIATVIACDLFADGRVAVASAGHLPPAVLGVSGCRVGQHGGPIPGFDEQARYDVETFRLAPGERLILITDGLDPDAMAQGDFPAALRDRLAVSRQAPLDDLCGDLADWAGEVLGAAPSDDWTAIIIERAS
jgi:serine phosphatase RsbU (regulator of sigma subunit)/anti-sigma regulatory factor (Ser/Thr protein kinase)